MRITPDRDRIDSREIIERIDDLAECQAAYDREGGDWARDYPEDAEELAALRALADQCVGYCPDWNYGAALIRDSHFPTYTRELAEDIGAVHPVTRWPLTCVDWDRAANELRMDYTSVDFDGVTFWVQ